MTRLAAPEAYALIAQVSSDLHVPRRAVLAEACLGGVVTLRGFLVRDAQGFELHDNCACVVKYTPEFSCRNCRGVGA